MNAEDYKIFTKAMRRIGKSTDKLVAIDDAVVFLEKEIDRYRDKIDKQKALLNMMYGERTAEEVTKKLEEWRREQDALTTRVKQLGNIVENKMDKFLGETVLTFTEERTSDGGTMILSAKTANWKIVYDILCHNGYHTCCYIDGKSNGETITVEFWKE